MNDALITVLREYGLNQKEAMIYLVLLELGKAPASSVARKAGLKRVTAYAIIQEMIRKGVATEVEKKGVKMFAVIDPDRLHAQWEVKCKAFASALPEFAALADVWGNKPRIQYFEGFKGVCEIYDDMLTSKEDIRAFVGVDYADPDLRKWLKEKNVPRRVKMGIKAYVIGSISLKSHEYKSWDDEHLRETRLVVKEILDIQNEICLYGNNRISIISFAGNELSGFILHSAKTYNTFRSIFDFMWNNLSNT